MFDTFTTSNIIYLSNKIKTSNNRKLFLLSEFVMQNWTRLETQHVPQPFRSCSILRLSCCFSVSVPCRRPTEIQQASEQASNKTEYRIQTWIIHYSPTAKVYWKTSKREREKIEKTEWVRPLLMTLFSLDRSNFNCSPLPGAATPTANLKFRTDKHSSAKICVCTLCWCCCPKKPLFFDLSLSRKAFSVLQKHEGEKVHRIQRGFALAKGQPRLLHAPCRRMNCFFSSVWKKKTFSNGAVNFPVKTKKNLISTSNICPPTRESYITLRERGMSLLLAGFAATVDTNSGWKPQKTHTQPA